MTDKTYEGLKDLLMCEHILSSVNKDLAVFLRERNLKTSKDMLEAAESYRLAHPNKSMARSNRVELAVVGSTSQSGGSSAQSSPRKWVDKGSSYTNRRRQEDFKPRQGTGYRARYGFRGRGRGCSGWADPDRRDWRERSRDRWSVDSRHMISDADRTSPGDHVNFRTGRGGSTVPVSMRRCYDCGKVGHIRKNCRQKGNTRENEVSQLAKRLGEFLVSSVDSPKQAAVSMALQDSVSELVLCSAAKHVPNSLPICEGVVNGFEVSVLRDSGATTAGVRKCLVRPDQYVGRSQEVLSFGGNRESFPLAVVDVDTQFFSGKLECCVIEEPVADLILGNVEGVSPIPGLVMGESLPVAAAVQTRAQAKAELSPTTQLQVPTAELDISRQELADLQRKDQSLSSYWDLCRSMSPKLTGKGTVSFCQSDGLLFRRFREMKGTVSQVVVPQVLQSKVLFMAHDALLAGHCGVRRTLHRALTRFWWPGIGRDVRQYCRSCEICQKASPKGRTPNVPLAKMPRIEEPFQRVAVDIIGPFNPPSEEKHRYVLTVVDVATRFPEAVPLKTIDSKAVAEALFDIFCRLGFPMEVLSDNGSQFTSFMFKEFLNLFSIKQVRSSPYHAQSNGVVERFHGTLKPMLRKVIQSNPRQWHRRIPPLLFACRELPNASTGFSPFELLFGRPARGPIDFLADAWLEQGDVAEAKDVCQYVVELRNTVADMCQVAQDSVDQSAVVNKMYKDKRAKQRSFQVGDEVLVFIPTAKNKLHLTWDGPFKVVEVLKFDYVVNVRGRRRIFHPNMLKAFHRRVVSAAVVQVSSPSIPFSDILPTSFCPERCLSDPELASVAVLPEHPEEDQTLPKLPTLDSPTGETFEDVKYSDELSASQLSELKGVFSKYTPILTTEPGSCLLDIEHEISLTTDKPVYRKQYPLPFDSLKAVEEEVQSMLKMGVIEPSRSAFSAPVVLVKKPDGSNRFCCDYRELNKVTKTDAEPIPDTEALFAKLANSRYFTKIDLTKGYWQIPVKKEDRHKTAFQTPLGLFQWTRMPFGLVTAPATFARMMHMLCLCDSAVNFFDDILIHSKEWTAHLRHIDEVMSRLQQANLSARPSKIMAGCQELTFLGHSVGHGRLQPQADKVHRILHIPQPKTKKQVRALLGLVGYYRKFIPNFAAIAAPISDLLAGPPRQKFQWSADCQSALELLQQKMASQPVLLLPDLRKPFVVRTDASSTGLGGVLLQVRDDVLHPVTFVSRKMLPRETRYSTIERECLAIVWVITKLGRYLWGRTFELQTDHRPLTYLQSSVFKNPRIMRWSLLLQEYKFVVSSVPGCSNTFADLLSR